MKTTIELPDDLLGRIRKVAKREGATLKSLIEEGLHLALRAHPTGHSNQDVRSPVAV